MQNILNLTTELISSIKMVFCIFPKSFIKITYYIDEIIVSHNSKNRDGFAVGAILAAEWIDGKTGFFTMKDVLNF